MKHGESAGSSDNFMAKALLAVGKNKRALTQLRRIFTQHPNYKDVAQLITELTSTDSRDL